MHPLAASRLSTRSAVPAALALALVLPGCGGGGGDDAAPTSGGEGVEQLGIGAEVDSSSSEGAGFDAAPPTTEGNAGPADVDGSSFLITGNNSARLNGQSFGRGTEPNASLRRSVPVRLEMPSADFEIEAAHVIGAGPFFDIAIVVTNRANATLCDIGLGIVGVADTSGAVSSDAGGFANNEIVEGSAARTASGQLDTQCLAPGESSYAIVLSPVGSDDLEADEVTSIVVPAITSGDVPVTSVMARVVPTGYTVAEDGGRLDVTVRNESLSDIESGYGALLVLDEAGYPLDFTNFFATDIVPAGAETIFSFDGLSFFTGRADTIRVILGYFDPL